ncbi:hypothetical protein PVAP13_5KG218898 [Panicum virgatum]|uniref:GRF-type domain-containing protein n=1 Tax=Panicum virgatum TaxID=38727 RepID=A0A8T0SMB6_PANVG|nr:hypothetical protein PVAP13_5KG218898 [Panicum virgatum]
MAMSDARYKLLGGGQYPSECDEDAPVPPALPVPFCRCEPDNQLAEVKQSRHPKTAGRAFYICKWNDSLNPCHCFFFQWIDGPNKFDPRIWLFPYYRSESWAYNEFRRWVPPPPNPPPMTEEEKQEAAIYHVNNPPKCHCGDAWPACDFNEYIYGPKSHWPTEEEVREFESGKKPWPLFGILTFLNVWLSIIFQEGRTCDWEWFKGRYELMLQLGRTKEPWKSRDTLNRKLKIRKDYQVTLPLESFLSGPVLQDLRREYGKKAAEKATLEDCIVYWRRNRSKYPQPLTDQEAQMEAMQALVADLPHKVPNVEKDVSSASTEVLGVRATQMEAIKALVGDLPARDHPSDWKGKAMDTPVVDNQGNSAVQDKGKSASEHDHIPDDGDDDEWWSMNADEVEVIVSQIEVRKGKAVVQDDGDDDDGWGELLIEGDSD